MTKRNPSPHALAAKHIRQELKAMNIKAAVRSECFAGGNAVRISVEDIAPELYKTVQERVGKYQYGHFNGMEDYYEYSNPVEGLPQVKFVQTSNHFTDELKQAAYRFALAYYPAVEDAPESYDQGGYRFSNPVMNEDYSFLVRKLLTNQETFDKVLETL